MKTIFRTLIICLFLSGCATYQGPSISTLSEPKLLKESISEEKDGLVITLYEIPFENELSAHLYENFISKGYLPIQIKIQNNTQRSFTFQNVQYAICDENYNRTRRIAPQEMAQQNADSLFEEQKVGFLSRFFTKSKLKKEYRKFEFASDNILPEDEVTGWLYFKVKEGNFDIQTFFDEIQGYQLEIAHIKDLDTNIIHTFYFLLDNIRPK